MKPPLYLDHAATTPLLPDARDALLEGLDRWANPSSVHAPGRAARAALEQARARIAAALGWTGEVILTSGASEALAIALQRSTLPLAAVSPVEHDAVLRLAPEVPRLAIDAAGIVTATAPGLNAIQHVNSETGVIQPLASLASEIHAGGGLLLADCAQSAGKLPLPPADLIAISAHKFGGPIGVGALLVRAWRMLTPTGGQEQGYRPGTENLPGALAMAAALEAGDNWLAEARRLRSLLESRIEAAGGEVIARSAPRLPAIGAIRMPGKLAAVQLIRFDGMGIAVSAGSACSSGSLKASHVLAAMHVPNPQDVIRVSIGRETTQADIERFASAWEEVRGA